MGELNSDNLNIVSEYIRDSNKYGLTPEVVLFALSYMKNNPQSSIEDAITYGYYNWIK